MEVLSARGFAVAAVSRLKERGDPWRLNEEAPTAKPTVNVKIIRRS
jgi:hypothetical protein